MTDSFEKAEGAFGSFCSSIGFTGMYHYAILSYLVLHSLITDDANKIVNAYLTSFVFVAQRVRLEYHDISTRQETKAEGQEDERSDGYGTMSILSSQVKYLFFISHTT